MQPEKLGPFRIGRVLGRGGMGAVYEGIHEETGESAAVKVLLANLEEDEELRYRFEAEIETLKRLRHPNIVRLFGFGEEQGMLYYVMEMVDGPSLHQEIKRKRLFQWHEAAKIGLEICFALKHAHDRGITHRDIKPANVLLERHGSIKLSDYGIAHFFGGQRLTEINSVVGTLEFMSPEQALANPVGPRSDLYSLGAVLYVLLVGKPPFSARNLSEILRKHQRNVVESIRATRLDVPDEMELIIFDLMKIRPEDRPQNAYLVAKRFQSLLQALVGPPEKIIVRPMDPDGPTTIALEPVRIPYQGDAPGTQAIDAHPRGMVVENGLIDLGGLVDDDAPGDASAAITKTQHERPGLAPLSEDRNQAPLSEAIPAPEWFPERPESGGTSFVDSFGRPGGEAEKTELRSAETVLLESDSKSGPSSESSLSENREEGKPPSGYADRSPEQSLSSQPPTARHSGSPGKTARSDRKLVSPPILHGEMLREETPSLRRTKDDPVPDLEPYRPASPSESPEESPTVDTDVPLPSTAPPEPLRDEVTRDNLDPPAPVARLPESIDDPSIPYDVRATEDVTRAGAARDATALPRSTESRFVSVLDETFDDYDDDSRTRRPVVSLQTVLASLCLILIGFTVWYLLQPVPPDVLFDRIKSSIEESGTDEGISPSGLRRAREEIDRFLSDYSKHAKADVVRFYKTELELAELDRRLERRFLIHDVKTLSPVERAYMEAISTAKSDPETSIRKLKALIDVFQTETADHDPLETDDPAPNTVSESRRLRLASPVELCVDAARRRLQRMEKDIQAINADQAGILRLRLEEAESLTARNPERAAAIWRGIVELYGDRHWAREIVEEARAALEKSGASGDETEEEP